MKKTKPNYIVYYEIIFIAMLFVSSFIIRIYPIHYSHWWDECIYLQHAEIISGLRENTFNEFHLRPPLLPVILSAGFLVYESVFIASVIMSLFGAIGVLFVYLLAKKLGD